MGWKIVSRSMACFSGVVFWAGLTFGQAASPAPSPAPAPASNAGIGTADKSDPLAVGKAALQHEDAAAAETFFASYVAENPKDAEAQFYLGTAEVNLNNLPQAAKAFVAAAALKPDWLPVHQSLVFTYARMENWPAFDAERALIKAARDAHRSTVPPNGHDLIDLLHVGGETFQVWYFYTLYGRFHTRYAFLHFDGEGKADHWVQCESDDVDQALFAQKHPKEAAAGERSYSLDSYSKVGSGMNQALIKFYPDGEPGYEEVRGDALKTLAGESKPAATTSTPPPAKQ